MEIGRLLLAVGWLYLQNLGEQLHADLVRQLKLRIWIFKKKLPSAGFGVEATEEAAPSSPSAGVPGFVPFVLDCSEPPVTGLAPVAGLLPVAGLVPVADAGLDPLPEGLGLMAAS